ncbi:hypothetical protein B6I21_02305 [candidate division KSB1 bacterium 4572_119]|nr:MAG: hypothetical protein B6I21_02305 [candidate division KSB1 bacterium 4572_119]
MVSSAKGRILFIEKQQREIVDELKGLPVFKHVDIFLEKDLGSAIQRVQTERFDVIVLAAKIGGMPIGQTIQILKSIDPRTKLIVKSHTNSMKLEATIRKENIYYYHLDSFGQDDLILAIESALPDDINKINFVSTYEKQESEFQLVYWVDEDDNFIEIHKTNLENHGFRVKVFFDADEAVQRIKLKKPDLLMVDINIPVGSAGLHFMEMMLDSVEMIEIPVLLFVKRERLKEHEEILDRVKKTLPVWSYLEKPVKIEDMIPGVKSLLEKNK